MLNAIESQLLMTSELSAEATEDMAQRARLVRILCEGAAHGSAKRFANRLGLSENRWYNYENGFPISLDVAKKLLDVVPGLTLDYIFLGITSGLTVETARQLQALSETTYPTKPS